MRQLSPRFLTLPAILFVVAACASFAPAPPGGSGPPPEPGRDLTVWLQPLDRRAGHVLWARNDSERIHRITSVTLRECFNIREACETHPVEVVLCRGEASRIFEVHPLAAEDGTYFRWDYRARSYGPDEPVVGADCQSGGDPA